MGNRRFNVRSWCSLSWCLFRQQHNPWFMYGVWRFDDLTVSLKPEIALQRTTKTYAIKLWPNDDPTLNKFRSAMVIRMMKQAMGIRSQSFTFALLDIRSSKLYESPENEVEMDALPKGQALNFIQLYRSVGL